MLTANCKKCGLLIEVPAMLPSGVIACPWCGEVHWVPVAQFADPPSSAQFSSQGDLPFAIPIFVPDASRQELVEKEREQRRMKRVEERWAEEERQSKRRRSDGLADKVLQTGKVLASTVGIVALTIVFVFCGSMWKESKREVDELIRVHGIDGAERILNERAEQGLREQEARRRKQQQFVPRQQFVPQQFPIEDIRDVIQNDVSQFPK